MDQPYNSLAMITAFTRGQSLLDMDRVLPGQATDQERSELLQLLARSDASHKVESRAATLLPGLEASFKGDSPRHVINLPKSYDATDE